MVIVFIGGVHGRTGTTLLKRLLCVHPAVEPAVPNETRLFEQLAAAAPFLDASQPFWTPQLASDALVALRAEVRTGFGDTAAVADALEAFGAAIGVTEVRGTSRPPQPSAPPVEPKALDRAIAALVRALLTPIRMGPSVTHICEKTPSNAQFLELIRRWAPEAQLVVMRRDPIDVALSHTRRSWGPADPRHAAVYTRQYLDRWDAVAKGRPWWLLVDHADLVAAPAATLDRIQDHVDLPRSREVAAAAAKLVRQPESRRGAQAEDVMSDMIAALRPHLAT